MKKLRLLNKRYLSIILFFLFCGTISQAQESVDIWKIEEQETQKKNNER